jgi:hypothetical protein
MLIRIPPFRHRHEAVDVSQNFWDGIKRDDGMDYSEDGDSYEDDDDELEEEEEEAEDGGVSDGVDKDGGDHDECANDKGENGEDKSAFTVKSEVAA